MNHILHFTTEDEVRAYMDKRPNGTWVDPEIPDSADRADEYWQRYVQLISRVDARGDGIAFYENQDLGHPGLGNVVGGSFGSEHAQFECEEDALPTTYPDGLTNPEGGGFNWRYQLTAVYRAGRKVTVDTLSDVMEFDHVIEVLPSGLVRDRSDVYAPELHEGGVDAGWTLLSGYSGQDRYDGPSMHQSEFIGGRMAHDILHEPGIYVCLVDYPLEEDPETGDPEEPSSWSVARKVVED